MSSNYGNQKRDFTAKFLDEFSSFSRANLPRGSPNNCHRKLMDQQHQLILSFLLSTTKQKESSVYYKHERIFQNASRSFRFLTITVENDLKTSRKLAKIEQLVLSLPGLIRPAASDFSDRSRQCAQDNGTMYKFTREAYTALRSNKPPSRSGPTCNKHAADPPTS